MSTDDRESEERNKASSTSDDPARAKRPILGCCWQTKKKTLKVLNCHSKMRPLDTEKDVQTKAQPLPRRLSSNPFPYIPRRRIDCIHTYILRSGREDERKKSAASQYTYKCCPNNRANRSQPRERVGERITPSARVSVLTRPSAICRL